MEGWPADIFGFSPAMVADLGAAWKINGEKIHAIESVVLTQEKIASAQTLRGCICCCCWWWCCSWLPGRSYCYVVVSRTRKQKQKRTRNEKGHGNRNRNGQEMKLDMDTDTTVSFGSPCSLPNSEGYVLSKQQMVFQSTFDWDGPARGDQGSIVLPHSAKRPQGFLNLD